MTARITKDAGPTPADAHVPNAGGKKKSVKQKVANPLVAGAENMAGKATGQFLMKAHSYREIVAKCKAAKKKAVPVAAMTKKRAEDNKREADAFSASFDFKITKLDDEKQMVYGFAAVSKVHGEDVCDLQGDVLSMEEITKAAHNFMTHHRVGGEMHYAGVQRGNIVESICIDADVKKTLGITRPEEGWYIGYHVTDPAVWQDVKSGRYPAFSIGGTGRRTPIED